MESDRVRTVAARALTRQAVLAGIGIVAGTLLAPALPVIWLPGPCLLAALGLALGRTWSRALAAMAVGLAWAAAVWVGPLREPARFDAARPVFLVLERTGGWRDRGDAWQASALARSVRQRAAIDGEDHDVDGDVGVGLHA